MSSLVFELQRDALNRNASVSDLLRKALVVSKKLKISEFEKWVTNELNGYSEDIPDYRLVKGTVQGWNPYHGWQPVVFRDPPKMDFFSERKCTQSIAEIEKLLEGKTNGEFYMPFSSKTEQILRKSIGLDIQITLIVPETFMVRILDAVRTIILNWTLKLEEDQILGEGMSFSEKERETAKKSTYNITNFYGPVHSSLIQQEAYQSQQTSTSFTFDLPSIKKFIDELLEKREELNLPPETKNELEADAHTIQSQVSSPKPKNNVIKESLGSIRKILEGAGGSITAQLLSRQLGSFF